MLGEIKSLTCLRFLAAFYIFIFHIHIRLPLTKRHFLDSILSQGAIGMTIFFMLSGFVLAYRYFGNHETAKQYLINRVARIYPIYIFCAILALPWFGIKIDCNSLSTIVTSTFGIAWHDPRSVDSWLEKNAPGDKMSKGERK